MPAIQPDRAQHVAGTRWPQRRSAEGLGIAEGLGVNMSEDDGGDMDLSDPMQHLLADWLKH
jgi:hypothetical protein